MGIIDWNKPKYPPSFGFKEVGDMLDGKVLKKGEVMLENRIVKFLHIATVKGEQTLWLGTVLETQLEDVQVGDTIGVKYLGVVKGSGISPYKNYDVRIVPSDKGIDTTNLPGAGTSDRF